MHRGFAGVVNDDPIVVKDDPGIAQDNELGTTCDDGEAKIDPYWDQKVLSCGGTVLPAQ